MPTFTADPGPLGALRRLMLFDAPANPTFDRLTQLAAQLLDAPIALLTLVDGDRQFLLSASGLPAPLNPISHTSLEYSICQRAVASGLPLIIEDTRCERCLLDNPAVADHGVIAYAGIPLIGRTARAMGMLCVIDIVPRDWPGNGLASLAHLAAITMDEIRLHLQERVAAHRRGCLAALLRPCD